MSVINRNVEMPPPVPDAPGLFRCAKPRFIAGFLGNAGFKNIVEKEVQLNFTAASIDAYWNFMTELAAPVVAGMSKADDTTKEKIKKEVYEAAQKYMDGNEFAISATALIIKAEK